MGKVESDLHITIILVSSVGSKMMQPMKVNTFQNKPHKCLPKFGSLIPDAKSSGITMNSCAETPLDTSVFSQSFPTISFCLGWKAASPTREKQVRHDCFLFALKREFV